MPQTQKRHTPEDLCPLRGAFDKEADDRKPDSVTQRFRTARQSFLSPARRQDAARPSRSRNGQCDYYPGSAPPKRGRPDAGFPALSCTAEGFSCPVCYQRGRWALTPPFHPYRKGHEVPPGGLFSATLSVVPRFREKRPWVLHGPLSGGVRTFLPQANCGRLPAVQGERYSRSRRVERTKTTTLPSPLRDSEPAPAVIQKPRFPPNRLRHKIHRRTPVLAPARRNDSRLCQHLHVHVDRIKALLPRRCHLCRSQLGPARETLHHPNAYRIGQCGEKLGGRSK